MVNRSLWYGHCYFGCSHGKRARQGVVGGPGPGRKKLTVRLNVPLKLVSTSGKVTVPREIPERFPLASVNSGEPADTPANVKGEVENEPEVDQLKGSISALATDVASAARVKTNRDFFEHNSPTNLIKPACRMHSADGFDVSIHPVVSTY